MKKIVLILGVLLLVFHLSYSQNPGVEIREENKHRFLFIDLDEPRDIIDFDLSEIVDSCRIIKFENREGAYIGNIDGIAFTETNILVYNQGQNLMAFDYEGNYLYPIGHKGKGPFEYLYINGLDYSTESDAILIQPAIIDNYYVYNSAGEGLATIPRRLDGDLKIMLLPGNRVLELGYSAQFTGNEFQRDINLNIIDFSGQTIFKQHPVYQAYSIPAVGSAFKICMYTFDDQYHVSFSRDTLFNIDIKSGTLYPEAVFNSSQKGLDYNQIDRKIEMGNNISGSIINKVYTEVHAETSKYYLLRQMLIEDSYSVLM